MKIQTLLIFASQRGLAFACMVFLTCSSAAIRAEDDNDQGDDEQENRAARIVLHRTTNAPAGASGTAKMENHERDGVATTKIEIHTKGLLPGTYTVTVFNAAQDTNAALGTFSIRSHDDEDDDDDDDGDGRDLGGSGDDAATHGLFRALNYDTVNNNVVTGGFSANDLVDSYHYSSKPPWFGDRPWPPFDPFNPSKAAITNLPAGHRYDGDEMVFRVPAYLAPSDLGRISITDEDGVEVLSGDLSKIANLQSGQLSLRVRALGGEAAPDGSGLLTIRARAWRGRASGTMTLRASNLPPRTDMHLVINGYDFGTVHTDSRGRLRLYRTQRSVNLFAASSVRVKSETGDNALKADF